MATDSGYYVDSQATESCVDALNGIATTVTKADTALTGIPSLPAPAAGDGVGPALHTFTAAWHAALPQLSKEMSNMASKVTTVKNAVMTTERYVAGHFGRFAN